MLKSQDTPSEQPSPSVGQVRVTPDELTQALAEIETRKQAEASRLAGTIPLEEAVSDLHLDSTPEEIWAEVQAQRAKAAAPQEQLEQTPPEQAAQRQAGLGLLQEARQRLRARRARRPGWTRFIAPLVVFGVLFQTGVIPHSWGYHTHIAAPILHPLAKIPDGKEVYADDTALLQISEGKPLAQIAVSENATGNRWRIVKISDHVYLRGYIVETDSLALIQGKALHVFNNDDSGELHKEPTSNITLRVDKAPVEKSGGDDSYSEVTVPNFQPDPMTTLSPWR